MVTTEPPDYHIAYHLLILSSVVEYYFNVRIILPLINNVSVARAVKQSGEREIRYCQAQVQVQVR